ncbi:MAG: radical SAM protein [Chloroflexi bacterium]|nr:radical SAM protein [Chloroflexota bacterium]
MTDYTHRVKKLPRAIAARLGQLDIELTERCNNDCIHCCINLPANDANARACEMTTAQVKGILTQAAALGCLRVRFTGGEPLLRPDFEELYLFARRLGIKVLLFTNARLITPHLADLFARIPPRIEIEITVYGMRAESYDAVARVPGAFAQFWRGVNLLLERGVPFIVKQALLPPNRAEIAEFEAWAKTIPWMTKPPSYSMNFDLRNRRDDARKNAQIAALRLLPEETIALLARDEAKYRKNMEEFRAKKFMGAPGDKLLNCGACSERSGCVDAYGRLQPCMGIRAPELTVDLMNRGQGDKVTGRKGEGEIQHPNDPTIQPSNYPTIQLENALIQFTALHDLRATNPEYLRRCARCFLKGLCEQCPAKSWEESGTLDTPVEYLCDVAHAQARWLGWLDENERAWESESLIVIR